MRGVRGRRHLISDMNRVLKGEGFPGRKNKGPEATACTQSARNSKRASVAGTRPVRG